MTKMGSNFWSKALEKNCGLKGHNSSSEHILSMTHWECYEKNKGNLEGGIAHVLYPHRASLVQNNCEYMIILLHNHCYFCMEEMAYRGHDETDESPNPGKWKQFIETMLVTNPMFKQQQDRLKQQYKHMITCQNVVQLINQSNGNGSEATN